MSIDRLLDLLVGIKSIGYLVSTFFVCYMAHCAKNTLFRQLRQFEADCQAWDAKQSRGSDRRILQQEKGDPTTTTTRTMDNGASSHRQQQQLMQ